MPWTCYQGCASIKCTAQCAMICRISHGYFGLHFRSWKPASFWRVLWAIDLNWWIDLLIKVRKIRTLMVFIILRLRLYFEILTEHLYLLGRIQMPPFCTDGAFMCSSEGPTSRVRKSFFWLWCLHSQNVGATWMMFCRLEHFNDRLTAVSGISVTRKSRGNRSCKPWDIFHKHACYHYPKVYFRQPYSSIIWHQLGSWCIKVVADFKVVHLREVFFRLFRHHKIDNAMHNLRM